MHLARLAAALASTLFAALANAQAPAVMRDLEPLSPVTLSKDDLQSRVSVAGNDQIWSNEPGGKFIVSSSNRAQQLKPTTAQGTGQISDDGRYCVLIDWRRADTEEWCRFVVKTSDGYYATKSTKTGTEKVYKLDIAK